MGKPQQLWIYLRSSFWFIPSLIVAGSIARALSLIEIEAESVIGTETLARWPRLFGAGPESARQTLSTIAGSMMSVVGVTFSMTLVALALVLTHYTSRVLGNFMRSRVTQAVLWRPHCTRLQSALGTRSLLQRAVDCDRWRHVISS
ncbi:MAG: DUF2254 domain-containing protein [Nitrosospira sp.]|nr:DUF2254 domain-containing protein [Nitrosospira sp.]